MSRQLSIERVLAELQGRIEHHRRKAAHHAKQEAFHQKEKVHHTAELQTLTEHFETFQAAADAVGDLVGRPREEKAADDSIPAGKGAVVSRLVERVVAAKGRSSHSAPPPSPGSSRSASAPGSGRRSTSAP